ncbi:MAG: type II secretion system GspH family protein [Undibacterium sp.]|nr:type II secretion system GspH family protein [Undibacterium sp.]
MKHARHFQMGFTLIEAIIVIVLTGILAVVAARFMSRPIEQYRDNVKRAALSDIANTAVRRISRDIHSALPNSVRSVASNCVEFIPTKTGGRYFSGVAPNAFTTEAPITNFDVVGPLALAPVPGDSVVIYNLGIPGSDAYAAADNRVTLTAATTTNLSFALKLFTLGSPGNRFHVIDKDEQAVSYVCLPSSGTIPAGDGGLTLWRISRYGFRASPAVCEAAVGSAVTSILADGLNACTFAFSNGPIERSATVTMRLQMTKGGETLSLYNDVNVNNVP